jgi:lysophospholipase L1-like esterase
MKFFSLLAILGVAATASCAQQTTVTDLQPLPATAEKPLPTLWLIGDSTVRNGTKGQQGWGDPLKELFDPTKIRVENRARGGRSSRTFFTEGLWDAVTKELKAGDFVLMQFGHNDGGSLEGERATGRASIKGNGDESKEIVNKEGKLEVVQSFGWYLRRYASDAKAKGATPIVLSLIPRNGWKDGKVYRANTSYGLWAKEAAEAEKVAFVDLNELVATRYETLGQEKVAAFFPHEHTHTSPDGARLNAEIVVEGLQALPGAPLGAYLKTATEAPPKQ